jgi:Flp pilus assembly protein TadG
MNRQTRLKPITSQQRRGAAVVEFALVVPLFFTVVFGIIEFGQGFMVAQLLNSAAREGARVAMLPGSTNAEVEATVLQILEESTALDPDQVTVNVAVTPGEGNPNPNNQVVAASKRDLCTVNVQVGFSDVALVSGHFLEGVQLRGSCSMRHE